MILHIGHSFNSSMIISYMIEFSHMQVRFCQYCGRGTPVVQSSTPLLHRSSPPIQFIFPSDDSSTQIKMAMSKLKESVVKTVDDVKLLGELDRR